MQSCGIGLRGDCCSDVFTCIAQSHHIALVTLITTMIVAAAATIRRVHPTRLGGVKLLTHSVATSHSDLNFQSAYCSVNDPNIVWSSYRTLKSPQQISIAQACNIDEVFDYSINKGLPEPFGVFTWESSYLMAELLENLVPENDATSNHPLKDKVVCDLCCGTGLTALIASHLGAKKVFALDYNQFSLRLASLSWEVYQSQHSTKVLDKTIEFVQFDMSNQNIRWPSCDYLLLSDVLYSSAIVPLVVDRVLEVLSSTNQCTIILTDPGRHMAKEFVDSLNNRIAQQPLLATSKLFSRRCEFVPFPHSGHSGSQYIKLQVE
jgi:predicted nicotinamide N-methyase